MKDLRTSLDYNFKDSALLKKALTHRSAGKEHNERLEFLGDALLGFVIAEELFKLFPKATEGELSRMRSGLVNRKTLAEIALEIDLGQHLNLGSGERKSGGSKRTSTLSDAVEAIIAAVYLDGGLSDCREVIKNLYKDRLGPKAFPDEQKDSKTQLQESMQARKLPLPEYSVIDITGEAHNQNFTVECRIKLFDSAFVGTGKSKRLAEQNAATEALAELNKLDS